MKTPVSATEALEAQAPALLYEMIRSFVTVARTLNLSHAIAELGSTRQTVRRHISQLEEMMGVDLFIVEDRRYRLTNAGTEALPEAENILARCNVWARGQVLHQDGMPLYKAVFPNGGNFYQQQKSAGVVWSSDRPLLAAALKAWSMAAGELHSPFFDAVRPYAMVYRNSPNGWVCVELGEKSSYVSWFGMDNARSSIGRVLGDLPAGNDFARMVSQPFYRIEREDNFRIDHIATQIPRKAGAAPEQICYARILLGCTFPDGSFALVSLIDRHNDIDISGGCIEKMADDLVMDVAEFEPNQKH